MDCFPLLPLKEGRLNDMPLRENLAYYRWTEMLDKE